MSHQHSQYYFVLTLLLCTITLYWDFSNIVSPVTNVFIYLFVYMNITTSYHYVLLHVLLIVHYMLHSELCHTYRERYNTTVKVHAAHLIVSKLMWHVLFSHDIIFKYKCYLHSHRNEQGLGFYYIVWFYNAIVKDWPRFYCNFFIICWAYTTYIQTHSMQDHHLCEIIENYGIMLL